MLRSPLICAICGTCARMSSTSASVVRMRRPLGSPFQTFEVREGQAMTMFSPILVGTFGGAIRIGRPPSNSAASSMLIAAMFAPFTGRATTVMSKTRLRVPTISEFGDSSSTQAATGSSVIRVIGCTSRTPFRSMKLANCARTRSRRLRSWRSTLSTSSGVVTTSPSPATTIAPAEVGW